MDGRNRSHFDLPNQENQNKIPKMYNIWKHMVWSFHKQNNLQFVFVVEDVILKKNIFLCVLIDFAFDKRYFMAK